MGRGLPRRLRLPVNLLFPALLLCAVGSLTGLLLRPDARRPLVPLSPEHRARLLSESAESMASAFSQPDRALEFYVNSRTGPINTRGPNLTVGARTLDPVLYLPAIAQMRAMPRYDSGTGTLLPPRDARDPAEDNLLGTWAVLGPANQGGRTRGLLIDPVNPSVMYIGGVAGGVWKSADGGGTWAPLSDLMANIAISTLAFDPQDPSVIYAGTGEGFFNFDAIRGAGIFRTTDAGRTWNQLASTNTSTFYYTNKIIVSPRNSLRIFAATREGLFRSTDGGASWSALAVTVNNGCTDMAIQRGGPSGFLFVACGTFAQATVYRLADSDASTPEGILSATGMGRSALAVAPSNEAVVYVVAAQATAGAGPGLHGLHGVYRSTANGDPGTFTTRRQGNVAPATTGERLQQLLLSNPVYGVLAECGFGATSSYLNQGWYDNVIAVDPADANRVWVGGVDLWRSDDGGVNWGTAGYWWFTPGVDTQYHHADQHAIVFHPQYNGTTNTVMFAGSDGGVDRVDNARAPVNATLAQVCGSPVPGGAAWVDRNNGYVTTQFYDGVPYPDGLTFFGGLQDNGTLRGTTASQNWGVLGGGDGGYVAVDTLNDGTAGNDVLFLTNTGNSLQRSVNGGTSFSAATTGITGDSGFAFIAPFTMNLAAKQQLWTGGWYVWRTTNQATTWSRASAVLAGSGSISALAAHPLDGNRVLAAMSDGYIHVTTTALSSTSSTSWSQTRPATAFVSWVAWDPNDLDTAYAAVSRFGGATIYKTVDGGGTWSATQGTGGTALPQIPALSVAVNPANSQQVFVGTDLGVFVSLDGGASWLLENAGFANTPVESVKFNETAPRRLFAFTHGRGAWSVGTGCPAVTVGPASLASGSVGVAYLQTLAGSGGTAPYGFVVETGTVLPPGLALAADGSLSGVPTNAGTFAFTVRAADANACPGTRAYSLTIAPNTCPTITLSPGSLPGGTAFAAYAQTITASGGTGPYTFAVTAGALPAGLTLAANGSLTGTPTAAGTFTFTVRATATGGCTGTRAYGLTVAAVTTTTTVTFEPGPYVERRTPYTATAVVTGPGGLSQALPVTYNRECTSAGTCTASADFGGNASYLPSSASASIEVLSTTDVQPPEDFRVDAVDGTRVRFRWSRPFFGPAPESYVLEGGLSRGDVLASLPTGSPAWVFDVDVPPGSWFARLRTRAGGMDSAVSNEVPVHVAVPVAPSAPTHLTGLVNGGALGLSWKNTFGGGAPTGLILEVTGSIVISIPLGVTDAFQFPAVPDGTYTFRLRALNGGGSSPASSPVTLTFPGTCSGAPAAPQNVLAYAVGPVVTVIWDPPASGPAPTSYVLDVTGSFVGAFPVTGRRLSASVAPGFYAIRVAAANACGASAFAASAQGGVTVAP